MVDPSIAAQAAAQAAQVAAQSMAANALNLNTVVLALISLLGTLGTAYIAYLTTKVRTNTAAALVNSEAAKVAVVDAAEKVASVKEDLVEQNKITTEKMDDLAKVAKDTHTLVNSNMGVQLKLAAELSDFKAATTKRPEDIQAATLARSMYEEHVKKQAVVDASTG